MIKLQALVCHRIGRMAACLLVCLLALSACSREEGADYCKNHYLVHSEHADDIGVLHGTLNAEGLLAMRLRLPPSVLDAGLAAANESGVLLELLSSPDQVYSLVTDQPCEPANVKVEELSQGLQLVYQSQCGAGNRVKQVNVELFELLDGLEEVEVQLDTAATRKHFAISRLCEQAIFRLKKPGQE